MIPIFVVNLEDQHPIVVDHVQEQTNVYYQRQQVLGTRTVVTFVDLNGIDLGTDENELNHDYRHQVHNSSHVVVEKEQFCLVQSHSALDQSLMTSLYYVYLSVEVLSKDLTVIVSVDIFRFVSQLGQTFPDGTRLFFIIDLVELYLFKGSFGLIIVTLET